jgi:membrane-associated phospholipid phosphatase
MLRVWIILLVFCFCGLSYGQEPAGGSPETTAPTDATPPKSTQAANDSVPKQFLKDIWTDQKAMWTSPFHMNRRQWATIALPLAAGTAALIATDQDAANWLPNTPDQVKWSKRVSNIGAAYTLGGMVGGTLLVGWKSHDSQISDIGRSSARALVDSVIVSYALKFATARERPTQNDGQGRFWKGSNSFPSAHAMDSWAVAMVVARNRKSPTWLKVTSCALATAVSLSRWGARKHFPSDILVGGVLGGLIGNYVATHPH